MSFDALFDGGDAHRLPTVYDFGFAPQAKADGWGPIQTLFHGTEAEAQAEYMGKDVALVKGATVFRSDDAFEFAVMARA